MTRAETLAGIHTKRRAFALGVIARDLAQRRRCSREAREAFRAACAAFRATGGDAERAAMLAAADGWRREAQAARTLERAPGAKGVA